MIERQIPRPGEFYRHFKGKLYQIIAIAKHSETSEQLVIYQGLYDGFEIYARPLEQFLSGVDTQKYPEVSQKYRFQLIQRKNQKASISIDEPMEEEVKIEIKEEKPLQEIKEEKPLEDTKQDMEKILLRFLDAKGYREKLEVFRQMKLEQLNDKILNNLAVTLDLAIEDGTKEERYEIIRRNLETYAKYECSRLR